MTGLACLVGIQAKANQVRAVNLPEDGHSVVRIILSDSGRYKEPLNAEVQIDHSTFSEALVSDNSNISRVFAIRFLSYTPIEIVSRHVDLYDLAMPVMFSATISDRDFEGIICDTHLLERHLWWAEEAMRLSNCYHSELFFKAFIFADLEGVAGVVERDEIANTSRVLEGDSNISREREWASLAVVNSAHFSTVQVITKDSLEIAEINLHHSPLASLLEETLGIKQVDSISLSAPKRRWRYTFSQLNDLSLLLNFSATVEGVPFGNIQCRIKFAGTQDWSASLVYSCEHPQLRFVKSSVSLEDEKIVEIVSSAFGEDLKVIPRH